MSERSLLLKSLSLKCGPFSCTLAHSGKWTFFSFLCFCLIQDSSKSKKHQYLVQLDLALTHWRTKMGFKSKEVRQIWTGAFPSVISMCQMYICICVKCKGVMYMFLVIKYFCYCTCLSKLSWISSSCYVGHVWNHQISIRCSHPCAQVLPFFCILLIVINL